ncbi:ROK family sugar kinase [Mycoplasmopsis californica]|uniref:ROK family protein n=1 Tax=Mycoplasmopsis equigenitalium TaxID=114883 RepID=A0ABY5J4H4_9BACT|nr:ROK family protein [Mycoplasmopsis equigenitalium]UUD36786.1 ROK family protein [Mycoplasmopsis equigenitalium]VEU69915.1 ROK family sugar kinase [Mycoplasmopsis californica]
MKNVCVDIGGTNIRIALFENDKIVAKEKYPISHKDYKIAMNQIIAFCEKYNALKLAICFPGIADYDTGTILKATNLPEWENISLKSYLYNNSKITEIICTRDSSAMALANHFYFKQNINNITQFFTISTGFGAGLIMNNKIYEGANKKAQIVYKAPWSSVDGITEIGKICSGNGMSNYAKYLDQNWTSKEIFNNYKSLPIAKQIINYAIEALSKAICSSAVLINPNLFVFGGAIARENKWFIDAAINKAKSFLDPVNYQNVNFKTEELNDDSALIGLNHLLNK